jgi:predicted  nucleic acid-binding Zn-ribbon protein
MERTGATTITTTITANRKTGLEQAESEVTRLSKLLIEACLRTEEVERQIIHLQIACKVSDIKEIPVRMAMYEEDVSTMDEMYNELQRSEEHVSELQLRLNEAQESIRNCEYMIGELTNSLNRTQLKLRDTLVPRHPEILVPLHYFDIP